MVEKKRLSIKKDSLNERKKPSEALVIEEKAAPDKLIKASKIESKKVLDQMNEDMLGTKESLAESKLSIIDTEIKAQKWIVLKKQQSVVREKKKFRKTSKWANMEKKLKKNDFDYNSINQKIADKEKTIKHLEENKQWNPFVRKWEVLEELAKVKREKEQLEYANIYIMKEQLRKK